MTEIKVPLLPTRFMALSFAAAALFCTDWFTALGATQTWKNLYREGQELDEQGKPQKAIEKYELALANALPSDDNARAYAEMRLTLDYARVGNWDKARRCCDSFKAHIKRSKAAGKLDTEIAFELYYVEDSKAFRDMACPKLNSKSNFPLYLKSHKLQVELLETLNPKVEILGEVRLWLARDYIGLGKLNEAESSLQNALKQTDPSSQCYPIIRADLAAVQTMTGRSQPEQALYAENRKKMSEATCLRTMGKAAAWAGDRERSQNLFKKALAAVDHKQPKAYLEEARIYYAMLDNYIDHYAGEEPVPYLRKAIKLLKGHPEDCFEYQLAVGALRDILKDTNKKSEADALTAELVALKKHQASNSTADRYQEFGDLLTDDELKKLAKNKKNK